MALLLDPEPGRMAGGRRSAVWAGRRGAQGPVWNDAELRLHFRPESFFATDGRGRHILLNMAINAQDSVARSEEHTSELQSLMRISYAVFCLKKKKQKT